MQQIEIDFEVFKALTNLRQAENHTYNEVIRDLLGLERTTDRLLADFAGKASMGASGSNGFVASGRFLPHGTLLKAKYKGRTYHASVKEGSWVDEGGAEYASASGAAKAITQTNVNGLTFWEAKRPSDTAWQKLIALPKASN